MKIEQGRKMVEVFGHENYLYARQLEDEAHEEGFRRGAILGFISGVICILLLVAVYMNI